MPTFIWQCGINTGVLLKYRYNSNIGIRPVEIKYDEVKNKLEIENFTGNSKKAIRQDFYATMYLSNIASAAWWQAQAQADKEREDKDNKYHYAINVNHEIGVLKDRLIYALTLDDPEDIKKEVEKIILLLAKRV